MEYLECIRYIKRIRDTPFSAAALEDAGTALGSCKPSDAREIARAMSETWQAEVLPMARELLRSKKGGQRELALELFAYIPDLSLIPELEAARDQDRSKSLQKVYGFAIRGIRKAHARAFPAVDPLDTTADPAARIAVLANLPHEELWKLADLHLRYWGDIEIPTLDAGRAGAKRARRVTHLLRSGQTQPYWLAQLLYIAHPLAGSSATQLVWEAEIEGAWAAFRGTREGGAVDAAGQPLDVPPQAPVRLAHPIELGPKEREAWMGVVKAEGPPAFEQLEIPTYSPADHPMTEVLRALSGLDERRMKSWLEDQGMEALWVHEHRVPHATEHVLSTDRNEPWITIHHDAIGARRSESKPIRIVRVDLPKGTPRRHSEAVRLLRELEKHASR